MLDKTQKKEELSELLGEPLYHIWNEIDALIEDHYEVDHQWNNGGKAWQYEYKYRRGGKTLCALYARKTCLGFMIILGKEERNKFEAVRDRFSGETQRIYDEAQTYHDGKWLMFEPKDTAFLGDYLSLLRIKRKPNR